MPPPLLRLPSSLEQQCLVAYLRYLHNELLMLDQMKHFEDKSVILKMFGFDSKKILQTLSDPMSRQLVGTMQERTRQRMTNLIIKSMHEMLSQQQSSHSFVQDQNSSRTYNTLNEATAVVNSHCNCHNRVTPQFKTSPLIKLLELILSESIKELDFGQNKKFKENQEGMAEFTRAMWKVVGEKCNSLEKFIISRELSYSSTLNNVIRNSGSTLTCLTLKRNVPSNMFLSLIGSSCPNLKELDIAGAEVVTDFGIVCLLFQDPEEIFLKCWNREKTVGLSRKSLRAFPHPHFDKPIPDPCENVTSTLNAGPAVGSGANLGDLSSRDYLILKRTFYELIMDQSFEFETFPICKSFRKVRLENTKVKGDGAAMVLEMCPNVYSLGYLVFAAAGLKQVFGYEKKHQTNLTEIFYRGPSDQKLVTIGNCCPKLSKLFLGSNSSRAMNFSLFKHWPNLNYLTLENIFVDHVFSCLRLIGRQLKGLKLQCAGFSLSDVALNCPNLVTFIIQKEIPHASIDAALNVEACVTFFPRLQHLEISCSNFPRECFNFIMTYAQELRSVKVCHVPGLKMKDFNMWCQYQTKLSTLIIFRAPEITYECVEFILESLPSLKTFGDLRTFSLKPTADLKKLQTKVTQEDWDVSILNSGATNVIEDKDFFKLMTLHWFYLTESPQK